MRKKGMVHVIEAALSLLILFGFFQTFFSADTGAHVKNYDMEIRDKANTLLLSLKNGGELESAMRGGGWANVSAKLGNAFPHFLNYSLWNYDGSAASYVVGGAPPNETETYVAKGLVIYNSSGTTKIHDIRLFVWEIV